MNIRELKKRYPIFVRFCEVVALPVLLILYVIVASIKKDFYWAMASIVATSFFVFVGLVFMVIANYILEKPINYILNGKWADEYECCSLGCILDFIEKRRKKK